MEQLRSIIKHTAWQWCLFILNAYDKYMDTSEILSFGLGTNSENDQMHGTWQLEKNHTHTETERMINFTFSKNHYIAKRMHGWKYLLCATPGFFNIWNYDDSVAHYLTEQRQTKLHPHPAFNITNVKSLAGNWKSIKYNRTSFPISLFYATEHVCSLLSLIPIINLIYLPRN